MNTKLFLFVSGSLFLISGLTFAQCVATQDCATLGYTESSCVDGSGVKCPFGNKWACFKSDFEYEQQFCDKYGFTQTCTGTNQTSGLGKTCNGKYAECKCKEGYEWINGVCQENVSGSVGNVYKCNGKVVGVKTSDMNFYVAVEDLASVNFMDAHIACNNYSFCDGVKGELPSWGNWNYIYKNKTEINKLLSANGGTKLDRGRYWCADSWSDNPSTFDINNSEWYWAYVDSEMKVRPVLVLD